MINRMGEYTSLSALRLWAGNYNEGDVGAIEMSVRRVGFNGALGVWRGTVYKGNHTLVALWNIKRGGPRPGDQQWPPAGIREEGGEWFVRTVSLDHLSEQEAIAYAIADNHIARQATQNEVLLLAYLTGIKDDPSLLSATGYSGDDIDALVGAVAGEQPDTASIEPEGAAGNVCPQCGSRIAG